MSYLLDTCVISELAKPSPAAPVLEWLEREPEDRLFLSVLTLGELQKGIAKLPDSRRREDLKAWLESDLHLRFAGRILEVDETVALTWGKAEGEAERKGRKMPVVDGLIAATALAHGLVVVTRDRSGVEVSGVEVFDPWQLAG